MTHVKRSAALFLFFCVLATMAGAQSKSEPSPPLFFIDDKPITTAEFVYLYRKNHQHKPEAFTRDKIDEYFDLFINYKLKVEEARERGMDTTTTFLREYETYRNELLKPYMPDTKVIDSLVQLTYERLKEEVNVSHILIRLGPDAPPEDTLRAFEKISALRQRVLAGEDFGALAAEYSEEPGAGATRGNLGFFTALQMVFPFEQAAYLTPVGGVSEPVRTQFGYHILKVHDRQPSRGEVEVSHIMIRTEGEVNEEEARNRIFDVHDQLRKGMDWNELCAEYSEDANTRDKGGRLRPFGVGTMASVPVFQETAFSLRNPGDISDPIRTQFGWHILRLESKIPLPSFEELKAPLTQRVSRDDRVRISREALRSRMRRVFGYQEGPAVQRLSVHADEIARRNYQPLENFTQSVLFSMDGRPYTLGDFLAFLRKNGAVTESTRVEELVNQYADRVQADLLEQKVMREVPDYKWLVKEYYEGILLFEIMEKEIWNRAMEDTAGQKAYYEANTGKYKAGERIAGTLYTASSNADIQKLKTLLAGDNPDADDFIARQRIRQDPGTFERKDRAVLSAIDWVPGLHTAEHGGQHFLIDIDRIIPPGPQTFDEARASVISDYQTFLEDAWIRELKRKFAVKVEKRAKKRAFAQLMDSKI